MSKKSDETPTLRASDDAAPVPAHSSSQRAEAERQALQAERVENDDTAPQKRTGFEVVSPVTHAGKVYGPGDELPKLTDEEAERLFRLGAIK